MSTFTDSLDRFFPGAVREGEFVAATRDLLSPHGFTPDNTLACVAVCRDEIAGHLVGDVEQAWGPSFSLASLAGMVTAGRSGIRAAIHHGPIDGGRQHLIIYAMPHVAIGEDGTVGQVLRPGVPHPSTACGALVAFREDVLASLQQRAGGELEFEATLAGLDAFLRVLRLAAGRMVP